MVILLIYQKSICKSKIFFSSSGNIAGILPAILPLEIKKILFLQILQIDFSWINKLTIWKTLKDDMSNFSKKRMLIFCEKKTYFSIFHFFLDFFNVCRHIAGNMPANFTEKLAAILPLELKKILLLRLLFCWIDVIIIWKAPKYHVSNF